MVRSAVSWKRRTWRFLGVLAPMCALPWGVGAYTFSISEQGRVIRWSLGRKVNFAANTQNASGLSGPQVFNAAVKGLQRWQRASDGRLGFDYWQGTDASVYPRARAYDGLSALYFASAAGGGGGADPSVIGLTQVWYKTSTGEILETDIVLNDIHFQLTTQPTDTSQSGHRVFIENVLTHELGHAFGLSHSGGLQATMLYVEGRDQAYPACDDSSGMRALYGGGGIGTLQGRIVGPGGGGVSGAHVVAISLGRGTVGASALTDSSGSFTISGLEAGSYSVYVEPFSGSASNLPAYYSSMNPYICGGSKFVRTFVRDPGTSGEGGALKRFDVGSGATVAVGSVGVRCSPEPTMGASDFSSAPHVTVPGQSFFAAADGLSSGGQPLYYSLPGVSSGSVDLHLLSYSLYSNVRFQVELLDAWGNILPATVYDPVYVGESGYVDYDTRLVASGLPFGDYVVRVTPAQTISYGAFATRGAGVSLPAFFVLAGRLSGGAFGASNPRCRMSDDFGSYLSPPGGPARSSTEEDDAIGFCGWMQRGDGGDDPGAGGGSAPPGQIIGWLIPWLLMGAGAYTLRRRESPDNLIL